MAESIEETVEAARQGDRLALETLVKTVQHDVYQLARRMLWNTADAEDAAQEILVKIVTNLATFRGESAFSTWVYRVACNHLLSARKSRTEQRAVTFESFAEALEHGLAEAGAEPHLGPDRSALATELMVACTNGMLLCLDRDHRVAYVLGEILGFDGEEAAQILKITPAAMRKRLSRARARLGAFMEEHCGIVSLEADCRCDRQLDSALRDARIDGSRLVFSGGPLRGPSDPSLRKPFEELHQLHRSLRVFRSHPEQAAPPTILARFRALLDSGKFSILSN
jgi:RNA polymerase sigma factor (sigma-70 family)